MTGSRAPPCRIHLNVREGLCCRCRNHAGQESQGGGQGDSHSGRSGSPKLWHPFGGSVPLVPSPRSTGLGALPGSQEKLEIWSFVRDLSNTGKAKQNSSVGGHGTQPNGLQTLSCTMRTLKCRNISLVSGKVGTEMGRRSPNSCGVSLGSTRQPSPDSDVLNHIPS